jgi:hypothetical protein
MDVCSLEENFELIAAREGRALDVVNAWPFEGIEVFEGTIEDDQLVNQLLRF